MKVCSTKVIVSLLLACLFKPSVLGQSEEKSECPKELSRCFCGGVNLAPGQSPVFYVNCTNTNFTDPSVLRYLPIETEILIFTGNNISVLPPNLFQTDVKYEKLTVIDLQNNNIESVRGKTFHNVRNVRKLILSHNKFKITGEHFHPRLFSNFESLEELHLRNAFGDQKRDANFMENLAVTLMEAQLTNLKTLHLEYNSIQNFPHEFVFCSLPSLQRLYLANNLLMTVKLNFTCTPKLWVLDLSDNFILNLNNESLEYLEQTSSRFHVNLTRNPFKCDCNLIDFLDWLNRTKVWVIGRKTFHCSSGYPEGLIGKHFSALKPSELECPTVPESEIDRYITGAYVVLVSLILSLCILLGVLIYTNRDFLSNLWTNMATQISLKREYTSLEKQTKRQKKQNQEVDEVSV